MKKKKWKQYLAAGLAAIMIAEMGPVSVFGLHLETFAEPDAGAGTPPEASDDIDESEEGSNGIEEENQEETKKSDDGIKEPGDEDTKNEIEDENFPDYEYDSDFGKLITNVQILHLDSLEEVTEEDPIMLGEEAVFRFTYELTDEMQDLMRNGEDLEFNYLLPDEVMQLMDSYDNMIGNTFYPEDGDDTLVYQGRYEADGWVSIKLFSGENDIYDGEYWIDVAVASNNDDRSLLTLAEKEGIIAGGNCGEQITWTLDSEGTLTISGTGAMYDYSLETNESPWTKVPLVYEVKYLVFDGDITEIGDNAFRFLSNFEGGLELPDGLERIGEAAFLGTLFTGDLDIPNSVITIENGAFSNSGFTGTLTLSNQLEEITMGTFRNCDFTGDLIIPESMRKIGEEAFHGCRFIDRLIFPTNEILEIVDNHAFDSCESLQYVEIPYTVKHFGENVFAQCPELKTAGPKNGGYNIEFNWEDAIPENVFSGCNGLIRVVIPENITSIYKYAFKYCTSLEEISIPDNLGEIYTGAFSCCESLKSVTLPDKIKKVEDNLFEGCVSLQSVNMPESITSIGDNAFSYCTSLEGITLPEGIEIIGKEAFSSCEKLESIILHDNMTIIQEGTFSGCTILQNVEIPNSISTIEDRAFYGCRGFTGRFNIPESVTFIGAGAFRLCENITILSLPNGLTKILYGAFDGCDQLLAVYYEGTEEEWNKIAIEAMNDPIINANRYYITSSIIATGECGDNLIWVLYADGNLMINGSGNMYNYSNLGEQAPWREHANYITSLSIQQGITSIGSYAFYECSSLSGDLVIPEGVTGIAEQAFYNCSGINGTLTLPDSLTYIGYGAFWNCSNISGTLTIPEKVHYLGEISFAFCSGFTGDLIIPDQVTSIGYGAFTGCSGFDGELKLSKNMSMIDQSTFYDCSGLTGNLVIPDNIIKIGNEAFYGCSGFSGDLIIPNTVITLGGGAFCKCTGFNGALVLSQNIDVIAYDTFQDCSGLTGELSIPDTVTYIGSSAFQNCTGFTGNLIIPDSVTTISSHAFYKCTGFNGTLTIGNNVSTIGSYAFYNCTGFVGNLSFPNSVTTIGDYTFSTCTGFVGNLSLPNSVISVGDSAFANCSNFNGIITLSENLTEIGAYAFYGCNRLSGRLVIPEKIRKINNGAFYRCEGLSGELIIPQNVEYIGDFAFSSCDNLSGQVIIPSSVTYLGEGALSYCKNLTSIVLPSSLNRIEECTFLCSSKVKDITFTDSIKEIGEKAFDGCSALTDIYFPARKSKWYAIDIASNNDHLYDAVLHYDDYIGDNVSWKIDGEVLFVSGETMIDLDEKDAPWYGENFNRIIVSTNNIGANAFVGCNQIKVVTINPDIENSPYFSIGKNAFKGCSGIINVYVTSMTEPEWRNIKIDSGNEQLLNATFQYKNGETSPGQGITDASSILDKEYFGDFNEYIYRANILTDGLSPSYIGFENDRLRKTPSRIITEALLENDRFQEAYKAWETFSITDSCIDDITSTAKSLTKSDIYQAVILAALQNESENQWAINIDELFDFFMYWCEASLGTSGSLLDLNEACYSITESTKLSIIDNLRLYFGIDVDDVAAMEEMKEKFNNAKLVEDFLMDVYYTYTLRNLNSSMKEIIDEMYKQCDKNNKSLCMALSRCKTLMQQNMLANITQTTGKYGAKYAIQKGWDALMTTVKSENPLLISLIAGMKIGLPLSNIISNTENVIEDYYSMIVISELEDTLNKVYNIKEQLYASRNSEKNAKVVLAAMEFSYHLRDLDCKLAAQLIEDLDTATVNRIFKIFDFNNQKSDISLIQKDYYQVYESILIDWIYGLEEDYPGSGLFEYYEKQIEESFNRVITKSYIAKCPVDVYILNNEDQIVAFYEKGVLHCKDKNVVILIYGDQKCVYIRGDEEYTVKYTGYDNGVMDLKVQEFDENGEPVRNVYFNKIPIRTNQSWEINEETKGNLRKSDSEEIWNNNIDTENPENKEQHTLTVKNGVAIVNGRLTTSITLYPYEEVTIVSYVTAKDGFTSWSSDLGTSIFEDPIDTVTTLTMPAHDVNINAILKKEEKPEEDQNEEGSSDTTNNKPSYSGLSHGGSSGGGGKTTKSITSAGGPASLPSYVVTGTWTMTADGNWTFTDSNGVVYKNMWAAVYNPYANTAIGQSSYDWFYFDANGFMVTGWITDNNRRYYLNPVSDGTKGRMFTGWKQIDGKWYYFNEISDGTKGAMITDAWIDEKYYVNKEGIWEEGKTR